MTSKDDVKKIINLARLSPDKEDLNQLGKDFSDILTYVEQLEAVDTKGVEPLAHVHEIVNIFREDQAENLLSSEEALANTSDRSGNFIKVPLIIEDEE